MFCETGNILQKAFRYILSERLTPTYQLTEFASTHPRLTTNNTCLAGSLSAVGRAGWLLCLLHDIHSFPVRSLLSSSCVVFSFFLLAHLPPSSPGLRRRRAFCQQQHGKASSTRGLELHPHCFLSPRSGCVAPFGRTRLWCSGVAYLNKIQLSQHLLSAICSLKLEQCPGGTAVSETPALRAPPLPGQREDTEMSPCGHCPEPRPCPPGRGLDVRRGDLRVLTWNSKCRIFPRCALP